MRAMSLIWANIVEHIHSIINELNLKKIHISVCRRMTSTVSIPHNSSEEVSQLMVDCDFSKHEEVYHTFKNFIQFRVYCLYFQVLLIQSSIIIIKFVIIP